MAKKLFLFLTIAVILTSCNFKRLLPGNKSDETASEAVQTSDVETDVENCFKHWNADNPRRPDIDYLNTVDVEPGPEAQKAYKKYIKENYGKEHSRTAVVRMYDKAPLFPDGSSFDETDDDVMKITSGDYTVYSAWRGPVVAKSNKTGHWFVVWDEDYNFNTKYITSEGNGIIKMEYIDGIDIDNLTDNIYYNLDTHEYYFKKEPYSGNIFWQ